MIKEIKKENVSKTPPFGRGFKILIIQQKMIGDVLTSSILFEALQKEYPEAELHFLIYPHTRPVVENNPFIDQIIEYNPEESFWNMLVKIRNKQYSVVIDVYAKIGTSIITKASGAQQRISFKKWYTSFLYSKTFIPKKTPQTPAGLAIENRMLLLNGLGNTFPKEVRPKIYLTQQELSTAKAFLLKNGINAQKPLLMIGVLGSSAAKTYPLSYMAKILNFIVEKTGANLLFNYIPSQKTEVEKLYKLCETKTQKYIHLDVFGKSLREFLALTAYCHALIGNEGGAVNMAKALDIPTFSIFSPQINKKAWAVYEDEKNQSVHLKDFNPDLFIDKKVNPNLYQYFKPDLIYPSLHNYLKNIGLI